MARGLAAHSLCLNGLGSTELPVSAERRIDVGVDTLLVGQRRIGLRVAVGEFAGNRLIVRADLNPIGCVVVCPVQATRRQPSAAADIGQRRLRIVIGYS